MPYGSPVLLTDLYELTMACAYWKAGRAETEACFHVSFRKPPFQSGFTLACGLETIIEQVQQFRFEREDLHYLSTLKGSDRRPLFPAAFLKYLAKLDLRIDMDAVPEGTVVFPQEPLVRVQGPILQAQILETALLNALNFQSLIATKAARICLAAQGEPVIEFGLRRAQGIDGGLTASRSAYVGGCQGTSNLLAGKMFGIPVSGTHAHSWVMSFDSELQAFEAYAEAMPNNCVLLVDTYDSLEGVRNAIKVGKRLQRRGYKLAGIRLDSGDLAYLSIEARRLLDRAGFKHTSILGSNDLDEHIISSLKQQGSRISIWGVGTKLVTAYDQPALGGVYKLAAMRDPSGHWQYKVKLSEQAAKITNPGILQVRRFLSAAGFEADAIWDENHGAPATFTIVDPLDPTRRKHIAQGTASQDLLVPVFRAGRKVYKNPSLDEIRRRAKEQMGLLHPGIKRFVNPHQYVAGLELGLHELKTELVLRARGEKRASARSP